MDDQLHVLRKVGIKVLEDWALMLVEEGTSETCIFAIDQPLYRSSMHFEGVMHGTVLIVAQKPFMEALTRNLLGTDASETVGAQDSEDAFREMANVLLGNFLTEAYGPDIPFALTNPQVTSTILTSENRSALGRTVYYFLADGAPVALTFDIAG